MTERFVADPKNYSDNPESPVFFIHDTNLGTSSAFSTATDNMWLAGKLNRKEISASNYHWEKVPKTKRDKYDVLAAAEVFDEAFAAAADAVDQAGLAELRGE